MNEQELLNMTPKRRLRNATTTKFGMFGLYLGEDNYNRLDAYCKKHNLYKATLVRALVVEYLDKVEKKE